MDYKLNQKADRELANEQEEDVSLALDIMRRDFHANPRNRVYTNPSVYWVNVEKD